jgi:hypothetical protein
VVEAAMITADNEIIGVLRGKPGLTARQIADQLGREASEVLDTLDEMEGTFVTSYRDRDTRQQRWAL